MRSLRQHNARDKITKQSYSSLSALPSRNYRNKRSIKSQTKTKRDKISSNIKSIQKTHDNDNNNNDHHNDDEEKQYDSTDSLDQLLDDTFIPNKSKPNHMKIEKNVTPRRNIISREGGKRGKRAKAMALMASTGNNNNDKYITPAIKGKTRSNFTSLRRSRKVITPTPKSSILITPDNNNNNNNINFNDVTPKQQKKNALKYLDTPCTPTPVKLIRNLNVKTPTTGSVKYATTSSVKYASWKDIEYNKDIECNKDNEYNECHKNNKYKLPLPFKWNILLQKFNALESTLALFMRKNSFFVHYQNIEKSVQQICKKTFCENDLQRIITIVPDFYHIQWTANIDKMTKKKDLRLTLTAINYESENDEEIKDFDKKQKENDIKKQKDKLREIGIKFLKVSKMKEREKIFRLRLIEYVSFHHKQFLSDNILVQFDPFQTGKWHKKFDLENVKDIEISPFPLKPRKNVNDIEKMIKEQQEKLQDIVQKEIDKAANDKNDDIPNHFKHLSPTFIAKIRAKKENKKKLLSKKLKNTKKNEIDSEQYRLQQLPYLVILIKGIYVSLKKSSMTCNDLINLIKKRHRNHHVLSNEIWKQLQLLNQLKSTFFNIKQGPMVKVAKINKKIPTKEVLDEINKKIKK